MDKKISVKLGNFQVLCTKKDEEKWLFIKGLKYVCQWALVFYEINVKTETNQIIQQR